MLLLLVALLATTLSAPIVRALMVRHGVLDVPNHRSSHAVPVPRGGGWACVVGLAVAVVVAVAVDREVPWTVLAGALFLAWVGFADDWQGLPVAVRLGAQLGTGALVGASFGGLWPAAAGALLAAVLVNGVNFMDGINGLTALTMAVWGVSALAIGTAHDASSLTVLGAVTAGCALGFLPWNAPTARLFLGDVGSYLFGAIVAGGALLAWAEGVPAGLLLAPMAIHLLDTGTTLARRAWRGESLVSAHRDHVYQRLVSDGGLPHLGVATLVALSAAAVTAMWASVDAVYAAAGTTFVAGAYLLLPWLVGLWRRGPAQQEIS